jgi:hypothetical protein
MEVIAEAKDAKKNMAQIQAECTKMINEEITTQVLDAPREKTVQAQT